MRYSDVLFLMLAAILFAGCATTEPSSSRFTPSYGYHPVDSMPVKITPEVIPGNVAARQTRNQKLLDQLPDESMRLAIGKNEKNVGLTYGSATTGYEKSDYLVVLDYIKYTTKPKGFVKQTDITGRLQYFVKPKVTPDLVVPLHIGVGLRLTANVHVRKGTVDLGNLFALGVAAKDEKISGTLSIQTLGLSGPGVSPLIPIPSEINPTTIQNALVAIGAIKAKLYDGDINVVPRVVGIYDISGASPEDMNRIISEIVQTPETMSAQ